VGGGRERQVNLARRAESVWAQHADVPPLTPSDYAFLIDRPTGQRLHRAEALAKKWGVLPHAVMIANGWLSASDYYRALAETCGVPFRGEIGPDEVTARLRCGARANVLPAAWSRSVGEEALMSSRHRNCDQARSRWCLHGLRRIASRSPRPTR
jgi:hypothetical protein